MVNRHIKRCSMSLIISKMQIKTTMRYHLTPVRIAIINKSINSKCWQRCGEKGILVHCWWECKVVQPLWKTVWWFLKKLKTELPYWPSSSTSGYLYKEIKTLIRKLTWAPMFTAALFTAAGIWKAPKCPLTDGWIKSCGTHIHTHTHTMECYPAIKNEWNLAICDNMYGPRAHYATWNKSDRDRQIPVISLICGI